MTVMPRLIGLDPGLRATGWGIIELTGNHLKHVANGVIHPVQDSEMSLRLNSLFIELDQVLEKWRPQGAAVESVFVNKDSRASLKLGQARGVVLLAPARRNIPVAEYAPNQVKKALVGVGHADKSQIRAMVERLLPGCSVHGSDAADALGVAICHAHSAPELRVSPAARAMASHGL
jgi:crossover junction endodeoxyribonuclease RuvC